MNVGIVLGTSPLWSVTRALGTRPIWSVTRDLGTTLCRSHLDTVEQYVVCVMYISVHVCDFKRRMNHIKVMYM